MKICAVQTKPVKGDIEANIAGHERLIDLAVGHDADTIIFPELSITGYEPGLAKQLATDRDDKRFDIFQSISDKKRVTIGIGAPIKGNEGIFIGLIIFQPQKPRDLYCKQYLHSDELPYFVNGKEQAFLINDKNKLAFSICYELSVPEHPANAHKNGADIYLSSVAKTVDGVEKAVKTLSNIAKNYSMTVIMANCIGHCDNFDCGGKTSAWNDKGVLIGQLDDTSEGILIVDTETKETINVKL